MNQYKALLLLIQASINGQHIIQYDDSIDVTELTSLMRKNDLILLLYPILDEQPDKRWKIMADELKKEYNKSLHKSLFQQNDIEIFLREMESRKEPCLPLKGWIMREYYPDVFLRGMIDFDVLVKNFEREKYRDIMESLGYRLYEIDEGQHDVYYKEPYTVIELHMSLSSLKLENQKPNIDFWLRNIWDKCFLQNGTTGIYCLTKEDFYIYHIIHMYKHITMGFCGIKPLIDIYLFLKKQEDTLDWKDVNGTLDNLGLLDFEKRMKQLSKVCFSSDYIQLSKDMNKMLKFICGDNSSISKTVGLLGRMELKEKNSYLKKKLTMIFNTIFLPLNEMTIRFPILKKFPFLLPICWILRIFKMAFEGKIGVFLRGSSKEAYTQMEEIYRIMGIK